jgi:hypothetical protein
MSDLKTSLSSRATRLGEFSPLGRFLCTLARFVLYRGSQNFGLLFSTEKVMYSFWKKRVLLHFGDFFTNSSDHPALLFQIHLKRILGYILYYNYFYEFCHHFSHFKNIFYIDFTILHTISMIIFCTKIILWILSSLFSF